METEETWNDRRNNTCEEIRDVYNVDITSLLDDDTNVSRQDGPVETTIAATNNDRTNKTNEQSVFNVEMSYIPKITTEESDLGTLGVEAYQIDVLEEGIMKQVDKAIEEQLQAKSILQQALEKKRKNRKAELEDGELSDDKEEKDDAVTNLKTSFTAVEDETEQERKIRMGEMTPFGNVLGSSTVQNIEKYLENQIELQKSASALRKKRESVKPVGPCFERRPVSKSKSPLKKKIFSPKKRRKKDHLGTETSEELANFRLPPGNLLSERTVMEGSSGSEYFPESGEESDEGVKSKRSRKCEQEGRVPPTPGLNRTKRKKKKTVDDDDWRTDDEDWEDSDCEGARKRRDGKEVDDGEMDDYIRRVSAWEKENNRDEIETNTRDLDNGYKVPNVIWEKLYKYQRVGVQWLWELYQQRCGGILGDEMGLGKTVQMIAFLAGLSVSKLMSKHGGFRGLGPVLIVCPTTLMLQWVAELHRWWPQFRAAMLHISGSHQGSKKSLIQDIVKHNGILITSYAGCVQQMEWLGRYRWHYVILDEGHKIRNPDSQVAVAVKQLSTPHRIILSGSPMQNNLRELWSLFDFIFPGKLGTLQVFMAEFAVPITQGGYTNATQIQVATAYKCATVLRDTISPYLLRRMKSDVKSHINLPGKNEQVLFCKLTEEQRELYRGYLDSGEVGRILQGHYKVFVGLINLRKICNHPDLYSGGPKLFKWDDPEALPPEQRFGYWDRAGKMVVVKTLLSLWKKQGHRVLVFTQSRQMLQILVAFVTAQGYEFLKLDGSTSIASRQPLINKFNSDPKYFVFLATTHVGGLGVNLTGANRVVIYDPDWNPATDTQARERAWRIGQLNQVTIYRLVTAGTIEEKIYHRQIFKQFLTNKVLKDPRQRRFFKSNDLYELFTLKETSDNVTETSALFAGTGSEVKLRDVTHKDRVSKIKENISLVSQPVQKPVLSQEKIEAMKRMAQQLSKQIGSGNITPTKADSCSVPQKKKKKHKKRKNALFEGEEVPHLVRQEAFKQAANDGVDHAKQDEYILKKLFSKSGIQTALKHDKIMEGGPSDYALVEAEAEKVAKDAVRALKESRSAYQRRIEEFNAPQVSPKKPRFKGGRFGKTSAAANASNGETENAMSVDELMARIRERNRLVADDSAEPAPLEEHSELLADIRNFVAFGAEQNNRAATQELLEKFRERLPAGKSPLFKALLYQICEFYRTAEGEGVWRLRPEFRW